MGLLPVIGRSPITHNEAWLTGRAAVAQRYRDSLGQAVAGALCGREVLEGDWKVVLLED